MKRFLCLALLPLAAFAAAPVDNFSPNLTATIDWDGNLTNGEASWDRIDALHLGADVVSTYELKAIRGESFHTTVHFAGDWYPRFSAIDRGAGGLRFDWQHVFGQDAAAPVFTAEIGGDGVYTGEAAQRGVDGAVTLKLAKRFGNSWRAALTERFDDYHAKRAVFDRRGSETSLEVSRDLNENTRIFVRGGWRDGDIVTYAQYDRPDLVALAHDYATLSTFGTPMTAYAIKAQTAAGKIGLIQATSEQTAIELSYEFRRTRNGDFRFENQTLALSFIRQY